MPDPAGTVLHAACSSLHPGCSYSLGCPESLANVCWQHTVAATRGSGSDMADQTANSRNAGKEMICVPAGPILSTTKLSLCKSQLDFEAV